MNSYPFISFCLKSETLHVLFHYSDSHQHAKQADPLFGAEIIISV